MADAEIDPLDRQILELLVRDARVSARSIARTLGVAAGTVTQRITRLEQSGVIRGYRAVVDPAQVAALAPRLAEQIGLVVAPPRDDEPADAWS